MIVSDIRNWLNEEPAADVVKIDPKSKGRYIPIGVVKDMLDEFCGICNGVWHTANHKECITQTTNKKGVKDVVICASVELVIETNHAQFNRRIIGAATISGRVMYPNMHWSATALSLSISNAAMNLGRRFGRYLNEDADQPSSVESTEEQEASEEQSLIMAILACDNLSSLNSWQEDAMAAGGAVWDEWRNQELSIIVANKFDNLSDKLKSNAERIIANKEVKSYDKLKKELGSA